MNKYFISLVFIFFSGICFSQADLVIKNAKVYTVNGKQEYAEAVGVKGGRIIFVGTNKEAEKLVKTNTKVIDCGGKFLMPGFIEGHGHIHGLGASLINLNLMNVKNWDEIVEMVKSAVAKAKPGEWIIGRGWHQEKWLPAPLKNYLGYPYHDELSKVSPDNPVLLTHASGHAAFVNAKAMEIAGINATTVSPAGGEIVKDKNGVVLGVLEETAAGLVSRKYTQYVNQQSVTERKAEWQRSMALAEQECLRKGVTTFHDAGSSLTQVEWMKELARDGKFNIRHWVMIRESNAGLRANVKAFTPVDKKNGFLTVRAIKVSIDGALGSYGAWLLEPYSDRPGWVGQPTFNSDSLRLISDFAWKNGLQLCVHAIGDKANREVIDIYSEQMKKNKAKDHRWRIEHAQHVDPSDISRFRQWKIIASMQGVHCTSDAPFVPKRLGDKRSEQGAYVWRSFLDAGVVVSNGTDVPVEDVDPIASFYASVTRKLKDGSVFYPKQRMTRKEGIYSYTMANAYSGFQEKEKGSIEVGKMADLVLLSNDLISCSDDEILNTKVLMTIVDGKVKYDANSKKSAF